MRIIHNVYFIMDKKNVMSKVRWEKRIHHLTNKTLNKKKKHLILVTVSGLEETIHLLTVVPVYIYILFIFEIFLRPDTPDVKSSYTSSFLPNDAKKKTQKKL